MGLKDGVAEITHPDARDLGSGVNTCIVAKQGGLSGRSPTLLSL